jgi:hypothetical protein
VVRFLQRAWQQGIDSGDADEVDFSALKEERAMKVQSRKALEAEMRAVDEAATAGRHVVDQFGLVEPQAIEVDQIYIGAQSGREPAAVGKTEGQ